MIFSIATTGLQDMRLPQWGRSFWQDPNDGELFLAYASGTTQVDFITSVDSGQSWSSPEFLFYVDDFSVHNNFDIVMDRSGHIHCGFRFADSGCYQFVGKKSGGGWTTASGIGAVGWITAGDSGVKGYQGSLAIQEAEDGEPVATSFPAINMVGKDSNDNIDAAALGTPFNTGPIKSVFLGSTHAGSDGGFPVIFSDGLLGFSNEPNPRLAYFDGPSRKVRVWDKTAFAPGEWWAGTTIDIGLGEIGFAPNMAIGSGIGPAGVDGITLVCTSSGQAVYLSEGTVAAPESRLYKNAESISNGTDLFWRRFDNPAGGVSGIVPTGLIFGVGPNDFSGSGVTVHDFPGGGTNCDFSFNDAGEMIFYFQMKNPSGKQSIGRFKSNYSRENWEYLPMDDEDNGLKYTAGVSRTSTGGFANTLFWGSFKALKHPTEPATSGNKLELIVTQGHVPTYPSGGSLTVWNIEESPGLSRWQIPDYSIDYTATSGTAYEVFSGIRSYTNVQDTAHLLESPNMFDTVDTSRGRVRGGYTLGLELVDAHTIDRIELSVDRSQYWSYLPAIYVSGSFDATNWSRVFTISSGAFTPDSDDFNRSNSLVKYQTMGQTQTTTDNTLDSGFGSGIDFGHLLIHNIDPFVAKYINFQFESPTPGKNHDIYEIKLYGPGSSVELITWGDNNDSPGYPWGYNILEYRDVTGITTENFVGDQGTLPPSWSSYGDFEWRIVSSGEAVNPNGVVESGLWSIIEQQRGTDDGFSLRSEAIGDASGLGNPLGPVPAGGIQPGHSGVVEVTINIQSSEPEVFVPFVGNVPSRTIGFNIRADVHIDDSVQFFTVSPGGAATGILRTSYGDFGWNNPPDYVERVIDPFSMTLAGEGEHTLRWIYNKGSYDPITEIAFGAAWIDNVFGLDSHLILHSRHGFVEGGVGFGTGVIHGYLDSLDFSSSSIHGAIPNVSPLAGAVNGYTISHPQGTVLSKKINGYLKGNGISVKGYVLATSGVTTTTFPTGNIHGYISVADSGIITSSIPGYLDGGNSSSIYGYTTAFEDLTNEVSPGDLQIHGYVRAEYPTSFINGLVGGPVSTSGSSIHGYINSKFGIGDQVIHGYIGGPSGIHAGSVNGFTLGWTGGPSFFRDPQTMIYGFVSKKTEDSGVIHGYVLANKPVSSIHGYLGNEALVPSGGGSVGSPSTSNVPAGINLIKGYVKGHDGFQTIHGYVGGEPAANSTINGYMIGGVFPEIIHGYSVGHAIASGAIHGYLDSVGFGSSSIHGYGFGISGVISSQIHGYAVGVEIPQSEINGILIGIPPLLADADDSSPYCPSHNYPLVPELSITLPSGFIN